MAGSRNTDFKFGPTFISSSVELINADILKLGSAENLTLPVGDAAAVSAPTAVFFAGGATDVSTTGAAARFIDMYTCGNGVRLPLLCWPSLLS